jgi:hypothetical protein
MLPPCIFMVLAVSNRNQIDVESAKHNLDTSITRCRVPPDSRELAGLLM